MKIPKQISIPDLFACMNAKKQHLEIRELLEQAAAQFEQ